MNRALLVILIPVFLVTLGYIAVFRSMGMASEYPRLIGAAALFFGALWLLGRRAGRTAGAPKQ